MTDIDNLPKPPVRAGIIVRSGHGCKLYIKDDGSDYLGLWSDFIQGRLENLSVINRTDTVDVYKTEAFGREFIIKVDRGYPHHLDSKLWRILRGPFYSGQMKAINRAVNNGCRATPDFFLVAEKRKGLISPESHVIMEFLQGRSLAAERDSSPYHACIVSTIQELHRHGMALCDVNHGNFFITGQGMKAIDLSWRGVFWTGKAKDALFLKQAYGISLPLNGFLEKAAVAYMGVLLKIRVALRRLRAALLKKES